MIATGMRDRARPPAEMRRPATIAHLLRLAALDWAIIAGAWLAMAAGPRWLFPFGFLIVAGRLHALGVVLHDSCHMSRRADTRRLALLQWLAGYPIATTMQAMRYHHLRHHRASGMAEDPYFKDGVSSNRWVGAAMRLRGALLVPVWIVRAYYGCAALAWPRLAPSYARVFLQDRSRDDLARSADVRECLREEPRQALFFVAVFAALAWQPGVVAAYYLGPLVLAGMLNVHRVIVEHVHIRCADQRPQTIVATTVTHDFGPLGRIFLFPHNIGFHAAHHLYPRAALDCLPALDRWLRTNSADRDGEAARAEEQRPAS